MEINELNGFLKRLVDGEFGEVHEDSGSILIRVSSDVVEHLMELGTVPDNPYLMQSDEGEALFLWMNRDKIPQA